MHHVFRLLFFGLFVYVLYKVSKNRRDRKVLNKPKLPKTPKEELICGIKTICVIGVLTILTFFFPKQMCMLLPCPDNPGGPYFLLCCLLGFLFFSIVMTLVQWYKQKNNPSGEIDLCKTAWYSSVGIVIFFLIFIFGFLILSGYLNDGASLEDRVYPVLFSGSFFTFLFVWYLPCFFSVSLDAVVDQYETSKDKVLYGIYKERIELSSIRSFILMVPIMIFSGAILVSVTIFIKEKTDDVILSAIGGALSCCIITVWVVRYIEGKMLARRMKKRK